MYPQKNNVNNRIKIKNDKTVYFTVFNLHDDAIKWKLFSALLAFSYGEFIGEFPAQRPVTRTFDVFFDLHIK